MTIPEPTVTITRYQVSILPQEDINYFSYLLNVDRTRQGQWLVNDGAGGYYKDGRWAPGGGAGDRFDDLDTALNLARRLAPDVTVNGRTAIDAYQRTHPETR